MQLAGGGPAYPVRAAQHPPVSWMAIQMIAECGTRPEHSGEPVAKPPLVPEGGTQLGCHGVAAAGGKSGEGSEGQIWVGRGGYRRKHVSIRAVGVEAEFLRDEMLGPCGISKTHPGKRARQRSCARHAHPCTVMPRSVFPAVRLGAVCPPV
jgi:hypothetical protein